MWGLSVAPGTGCGLLLALIWLLNEYECPRDVSAGCTQRRNA